MLGHKIAELPESMEAQRKRVRSSNPAERRAAALLIPAELSRRLLGNSDGFSSSVRFFAARRLRGLSMPIAPGEEQPPARLS
jgi:hypothetical protein